MYFHLWRKEYWVSVKGYEGLYDVSSFGRVRSLDRWVNVGYGGKRLVRGKILKNCPATDGYLLVTLHKNGVQETGWVHRLVAQKFHPNPNNLPEVNHLDYDKANNHAYNLEWCTRSENMNHAYENGVGHQKRVEQWTKDRKTLIATFISTREATRKTGIQNQHIGQVASEYVNKKGYTRKSAGGYFWKYA